MLCDLLLGTGVTRAKQSALWVVAPKGTRGPVGGSEEEGRGAVEGGASEIKDRR